MNRLPVTGSRQLLDRLDPFIPDDFINTHWSVRPVRGPRWQFSAAQLWRVHLLALLTPVHSLNLLTRLLPEQRAWRDFARFQSPAINKIKFLLLRPRCQLCPMQKQSSIR